ncbi:riboflavin biosynthesis protein [Patiriisocius marinistellae]|uniref:Riboflavin biosynthesis protein n=1 Tax=Patiriisocius marinistellae TaxID=2494560 RepID=A0A5J4FYK2_9FLAO|nr:bifunctional riboflavin kinase/FAD synthetase [Patiriisocius marinistellae]GEQ85115.1 riboflavin biosynthesis protein [Patiriisocius marinistellae]
MEEYLDASTFNSTTQSVITIGTFDGVHIGHKAIVERLVSAAKKDGLESVVLTFFPHPRMVLQKDSNIKLINTLQEKKQLLEAAGLDHFVVEPFTYEFSRLSALQYVRDILVEKLKAKKIIIGYDHRFGRNRNADINDLKAFGKEFGFEVEEISAQQLDEVSVSSTKIRRAIEAGDINTANDYLGYNFMISGTVVKGKAIGRTLKYPTANLAIAESYKLVPVNGVYVVESKINDINYYGITSIGTNPTVGGTSKTIETYFLDFDGDLYGKKLNLEFLTHIRDEETFKNLDMLKEAINKDELFARSYISEVRKNG